MTYAPVLTGKGKPTEQVRPDFQPVNRACLLAGTIFTSLADSGWGIGCMAPCCLAARSKARGEGELSPESDSVSNYQIFIFIYENNGPFVAFCEDFVIHFHTIIIPLWSGENDPRG